MQYLFKLHNLEETENFAKQIAASLASNFVITLTAELGSGKTTLVRHILYALGVKGSVKSPTYTIVEPYSVAGLDLYHFDLYRFNDPEEWFDAGFDEYFVHHSICFIEWAEKAIELIPVIDWQIIINVVDEIRVITINATSNKGIQCLSQLISSAAE